MGIDIEETKLKKIPPKRKIYKISIKLEKTRHDKMINVNNKLSIIDKNDFNTKAQNQINEIARKLNEEKLIKLNFPNGNNDGIVSGMGSCFSPSKLLFGALSNVYYGGIASIAMPVAGCLIKNTISKLLD